MHVSPQSDSIGYLNEQLKKLQEADNTDMIRNQKAHALVIGFAGKDRVGKTTLAVQTQHMLGEKTHLCSFAEEIRETITNTFADFLFRTHMEIFGSGMEVPWFDNDDWMIYNKSLAREMMRTFGTDTIRKKISKDYWILLAQYKNFYKNPLNPNNHVYIFHDVRYRNELQWIRSFKNNVVFYICREDERKLLEDMEYAKINDLITRKDVNPAEIIWNVRKSNTEGLSVVSSYLSNNKLEMSHTKRERIFATLARYASEHKR